MMAVVVTAVVGVVGAIVVNSPKAKDGKSKEYI